MIALRYHLLVADADPRGALRLERDQLQLTDEILCGACGALLAVDHGNWSNAGSGDAPGTVHGVLSCKVCTTRNATEWYVPQVG